VPSYNTSVQEAKDDALIALYGERRGQPLAFPMIRDDDLARATAQRMLQRGTAVLNQYEFRLGWRHVLLEPMDWGYITDAQLGLVQHPCASSRRARTSTARSPSSPRTIPAPARSSRADGGRLLGRRHAEHLRRARIRRGAGDLRGARQPRVDVGRRALDRRHRRRSELGRLQCLDEYRRRHELPKIAVQPQGSRYGALTALLAAWGSAPTLDTTHTLAVALLGARDTTLASVTSAEASAGVTLCYVGGATREFLAFQTATLTGAAAYNLTTLARALRGSTDGSHASGAPFVRCDETIVRIPFPPASRRDDGLLQVHLVQPLRRRTSRASPSVVAYPFTFQNIGGPAGGNTTDALVAQLPFFDSSTTSSSVPPCRRSRRRSTAGSGSARTSPASKSARIVAMVATAVAGTALKLSYSTNNGASWTRSHDVQCRGDGRGASLWFALPAAMAADVLLKLETTGGDGATTLELSSARAAVLRPRPQLSRRCDS
jgi:hypothetical protein